MNLCVDDKDQNFIWNDLNLRCNFHGQLEIDIVSCECLWVPDVYLDGKCSSHIIIANSFDRNNRIHWEKCVMQLVTSTDSRRILHRVHAYVLTLSVYTWIVSPVWLFYCCVCVSVLSVFFFLCFASLLLRTYKYIQSTHNLRSTSNTCPLKRFKPIDQWLLKHIYMCRI